MKLEIDYIELDEFRLVQNTRDIKDPYFVSFFNKSMRLSNKPRWHTWNSFFISEIRNALNRNFNYVYRYEKCDKIVYKRDIILLRPKNRTYLIRRRTLEEVEILFKLSES